jgi:uridine kinase
MTRHDLLSELVGRTTRVTRSHPVRVAIDGVDAAGKTTLADELVAPLERAGRVVIRASIDGFHHPAAVCYPVGRSSPEGYFRDSFNHAQLVKTLLAPLGPGGNRRYRRAIFDFGLDQPVEAPLEEASPGAVLLFDGVFLLRPGLRPYWDFSVFVRADVEVTVARAEARDHHLFGRTEHMRQRYAERYVPGQQQYLAEAQPERYASVVVDHNDAAHPRLGGL